jgi:hypothetical protein
MVTMFWMIVGAISVPLKYGFLRTKKFYDGVLIVAPGYVPLGAVCPGQSGTTRLPAKYVAKAGCFM